MRWRRVGSGTDVASRLSASKAAREDRVGDADRAQEAARQLPARAAVDDVDVSIPCPAA